MLYHDDVVADASQSRVDASLLFGPVPSRCTESTLFLRKVPTHAHTVKETAAGWILDVQRRPVGASTGFSIFGVLSKFSASEVVSLTKGWFDKLYYLFIGAVSLGFY